MLPVIAVNIDAVRTAPMDSFRLKVTAGNEAVDYLDGGGMHLLSLFGNRRLAGLLMLNPPTQLQSPRLLTSLVVLTAFAPVDPVRTLVRASRQAGRVLRPWNASLFWAKSHGMANMAPGAVVCLPRIVVTATIPSADFGLKILAIV